MAVRLRPRRSRLTAWLPLVLACYTGVLLLSAAQHHDLACHVKSPGHCDACTANPPASSTEVRSSVADGGLPEAGGVTAIRHEAPDLALSTDAGGRSPPSLLP